MMLDEKSLVMLQKLGLTYYGARIYATLVAIGPSDATKLSVESEVPRSKIYEVLRRLVSEKWVTVEHTRPITYTARYPKEILDEQKAAFNSEIDETSNELSMLYDKLMDKENPKVWLLRGMDNITVKILDMIGRAKKSVMLLGALYSEKELELIKDPLASAKKKGLIVHAISRRSLKLAEGELDLLKSLTPIVSEIKIGGPEFSKFVIIDDREMLIMYSKIDGNIPDMDSTIAIWIPNASVASYQASTFNAIWNGKAV
jgi:HTH-type transcriptional regulator, sugar sensing transcriptional regulator